MVISLGPCRAIFSSCRYRTFTFMPSSSSKSTSPQRNNIFPECRWHIMVPVATQPCPVSRKAFPPSRLVDDKQRLVSFRPSVCAFVLHSTAISQAHPRTFGRDICECPTWDACRMLCARFWDNLAKWCNQASGRVYTNNKVWQQPPYLGPK